MGEQPAQPSPVMTWAAAKAFFRRLGPAGILAIIATTLPPLGGFVLIGLSGHYVAPWLRSHPTGGPFIYAGGFAFLAGFALLPTYAQSLLGGMAFGFRTGLMFALLGFGTASLIAYAIARRASGDRVMTIINEHQKWRLVYDALVGRGFWRTLGIVTLLRIPPNSPFALTNLVMAATRVPWAPYLIGTVVGMAPRTAAVVYFGTGVKEWTDSDPYRKWTIAISAVLMLAVVGIISYIANHALARVTGPGATPPDQTGRAA